MGSIKKIGTR